MRRLITLAVLLTGMLAVAAPAQAVPPITGEWICVAVPATDIGACVGNPLP